MRAKQRIVVTGFVGLYPYGGVAWDYLQYVIGFADLGWDVVYLEDTREWPIYQTQTDHTFNVAHVASTMERLGLAGRWAYRDEVSGECFGLSESALLEFCRTADVLLNVSCSATLREEYARIPIRALVDTDPMFTQIQYIKDGSLSGGPGEMRALIDNHTHRFTLGANIGAADCRIPTLGLDWQPTRPPVVLRLWHAGDPPAGAAHAYSTVMNWNVNEDIEFDGRRWGQKDVEFLRVLQLPRRVPEIPLEIAVSYEPDGRFPREAIRRAGWRVVDPAKCASDAAAYRHFIVSSRGEFSVAKQTYVEAKTGWFSCRSVCYLAAGRPVVAQDTAWSRFVPHGCGLLAFHDEETAAEALRQVEADPKLHSEAARAVAEEHFDSNRVLDEMLAHLGSVTQRCA